MHERQAGLQQPDKKQRGRQAAPANNTSSSGGRMVLAERNAESVRNGRRSQGPSPNGQTDSSDEDEGEFFLAAHITQAFFARVLFRPGPRARIALHVQPSFLVLSLSLSTAQILGSRAVFCNFASFFAASFSECKAKRTKKTEVKAHNRVPASLPSSIVLFRL